MNYKLAKQLSEAGFPQASYVGAQWYAHGGIIRQTKPMSTVPDGYLYLPTLEEIIEACGDDYFTLSGIGSDWLAVYGVKGVKYGEVRGKIRIEAIARLWLALNSDTSKR